MRGFLFLMALLLPLSAAQAGDVIDQLKQTYGTESTVETYGDSTGAVPDVQYDTSSASGGWIVQDFPAPKKKWGVYWRPITADAKSVARFCRENGFSNGAVLETGNSYYRVRYTLDYYSTSCGECAGSAGIRSVWVTDYNNYRPAATLVRCAKPGYADGAVVDGMASELIDGNIKF